MARSPLHAPGPGSGRAARTARLLWPLALTLALATFLTGAALIARYGPVAPALGTGVAGVAALALLERLRRDHRAALDEARRQAGLVAARDEEAVRRDAGWRAYTEEQAGYVRDELVHLLKERLPAATSGTGGIPPAGPAAAELAGTMPEVPGLLDRLLAEVAQEAAAHAESRPRTRGGRGGAPRPGGGAPPGPGPRPPPGRPPRGGGGRPTTRRRPRRRG
ncbi:hypothetical protein ACFV3O_09935, partial [Streptomyces albidoflavus]